MPGHRQDLLTTSHPRGPARGWSWLLWASTAKGDEGFLLLDSETPQAYSWGGNCFLEWMTGLIPQQIRNEGVGVPE